jgi:hypothetical protein
VAACERRGLSDAYSKLRAGVGVISQPLQNHDQVHAAANAQQDSRRSLEITVEV